MNVEKYLAEKGFLVSHRGFDYIIDACKLQLYFEYNYKFRISSSDNLFNSAVLYGSE